MMKKSFLTVLFALFCTMGFAQLSFNVKAGLNLSSYIGENSDHSKFKPGARIGVGMEYQFSGLVSLQPSLFFSQKGAKYSSGYSGSVVDADADVKINQLYLELPLMVGARIHTASNFDLLFKGGPYLAYGVGGKTKIDGVSEKADTFGDDGLKRFDAGLGLGVAFEFGNIVVGVETGTSFTKVASGVSAHNLSALATIGYKF